VEYLDHTADIWLYVEAEAIENLILRSIEGLYGIMAEEFEIDAGTASSFHCEAGNIETVFVKLLSDILYYFEAEGIVFQAASASLSIDRGIYRIDIDGSKHGFIIPEGKGGLEIKAITYHGADVALDDLGKWHMKLLLDL
jgi:SHS2 domain-containing protein